MSLKKRIENILLNYQIAREESKVNMLEQIADEFAIGFAKWLNGTDVNDEFLKKHISTKELLEIYKNETGV